MGHDSPAAKDARTTHYRRLMGEARPFPGAAALHKSGVDRRRAIAVGDSVWDIQAARSAGVGCIAVETGGFSQHELSEAGALRVYRDVQELLDQLRTSPVRSLVVA